MNRIDLNCDMGESFGAYVLGSDEHILDHVTSANIACGFHAGDPTIMRRTVRTAIDKGVAIGAHPGYRDIEGFGRRFLDITPDEAYDMTVYQVGALYGFVLAAGARMQHVKPHGALYNAAAADSALAEALATAVKDVDRDLILFGLAGSELTAAADRVGLNRAGEAFADRTYQPDGTLTSRRVPGSLIHDDATAYDQAIRLVTEGRVRAVEGGDIELHPDTICIHGDGPRALPFARLIRSKLEQAGIEVKPVSA